MNCGLHHLFVYSKIYLFLYGSRESWVMKPRKISIQAEAGVKAHTSQHLRQTMGSKSANNAVIYSGLVPSRVPRASCIGVARSSSRGRVQVLARFSRIRMFGGENAVTLRDQLLLLRLKKQIIYDVYGNLLHSIIHFLPVLHC